MGLLVLFTEEMTASHAEVTLFVVPNMVKLDKFPKKLLLNFPFNNPHWKWFFEIDQNIFTNFKISKHQLHRSTGTSFWQINFEFLDLEFLRPSRKSSDGVEKFVIPNANTFGTRKNFTVFSLTCSGIIGFLGTRSMFWVFTHVVLA